MHVLWAVGSLALTFLGICIVATVGTYVPVHTGAWYAIITIVYGALLIPVGLVSLVMCLVEDMS